MMCFTGLLAGSQSNSLTVLTGQTSGHVSFSMELQVVLQNSVLWRANRKWHFPPVSVPFGNAVILSSHV